MDGKRTALDTQATEIGESKEVSVKARKNLAKQTQGINCYCAYLLFFFCSSILFYLFYLDLFYLLISVSFYNKYCIFNSCIEFDVCRFDITPESDIYKTTLITITEFKKQSDTEKLSGLGALLKLYQDEVK